MLDLEWIYSAEKGSSYDASSFVLFEECRSEDRAVISEIHHAIENLEHGLAAFSFYDLHFNNYEHEILSNLKLASTNFLTLYSENNLISNLLTFLDSVIDQDSHIVNMVSNLELAGIIARITFNIIDGSGYEDATISLIAYHNGLGEYFPSWHIDKTFAEEIGSDFGCASSQNVFIITLKGASTLYHEMNKTVQEEFNLLANSSTHSYGYDENLEYMQGQGIDRLFKIATSESAEFGEGSVHLAGKLKGTIHSTSPGLERWVVIVKPYDHELIQRF
ncbi:hypothetical protein NOVO_02095 [Rickettsiales bacterium Ac37b]|nr:hypothetical protein NOVO_02095 [Rickettsiales bacterium Ac37b]